MESYTAAPSVCTNKYGKETGPGAKKARSKAAFQDYEPIRLGFFKRVDRVNRDASRHRVDIYKITFVDAIVIVLILLLATGVILKTTLGLNWQFTKNRQASIYHDGKLNKHLKLAEDQEVILLDGKMVVEIKGKKVRVKKSDCPRQLCVKTGWIQHSGEAIVCVPFKTVIEIESAGAPAVDAVVF